MTDLRSRLLRDAAFQWRDGDGPKAEILSV
jgi:hypothetical protein